MICAEVLVLFILMSEALLTQSQVIRDESCKTGFNVVDDVFIKLKELQLEVLALSRERELAKTELKEVQDRLQEIDNQRNTTQGRPCYLRG